MNDINPDEQPVITMIAALDAQTRIIGSNNELPWHLKDDLAYFKKHTKGSPVIMGRATFESIGMALPDRTNIVLTRNTDWSDDDVVVVHNKKEALRAATLDNESGKIWIIGGQQIYELFLDDAQLLYLTLVDSYPGDQSIDQDADNVSFPEYEHLFTRKISSQRHHEGGYGYRWVVLGKEE